MKEQLRVYKRLEIIPDLKWEELVKELINQKGATLILGATDSGKSTLSRYLLEMLVSKNIVISLVDSDIGQTSIGIPGTISMKIFRTTENIKDFCVGIDSYQAEKIFFIGSLNPAKKIPLMIHGTKKLVENARTESELVLIDTTGLIHGEAGRALKIGKIKAIRPEHLVAIQRHNELEHLLSLIEDVNIHRIKASKMAIKRSREVRTDYRKKRFNEYFDETKVTEFLLDKIDIFYNGKPFNPKEMRLKEGTLIGLNHNEDTSGLGILLGLNGNSINFKSPIKSVRGINRIVLGDINIYKQGE